MSLAQSLLQLAQQSGAKDLPVCEKAVVDASVEQRSMVNALLETGQVDEKVLLTNWGVTWIACLGWGNSAYPCAVTGEVSCEDRVTASSFACHPCGGGAARLMF